MPRQCSVCTHLESAAITKELLAGGSTRGVASRYGTTGASVGRHLRGCLRVVRRAEASAQDGTRAESAALSRFDSSDPQSLVATTARLVDEALGLLEHAKNAGDRRTALQALREARDGLALLMRVAGLLAPDNSVTVAVDARKQSIQLLGKLTEDELRALARGAMNEPGAIETAFRDSKDAVAS